MHGSDERQAFHAAIWQAPDDDLPRLVYADWLDERNEHDAANFLRLLCAVHTCPPDVDKLRPLVAAFRRAMVKLPAGWIDAVCPVPPAVVVGAWVDVEREENQTVLNFIRGRRRVRSGGVVREELASSPRPGSEVRWEAEEVVGRLWEELAEVLSPAAACAIDGVPSLVDVWSGIVLATADGGWGYILRTAGTAPQMIANWLTDWQGRTLQLRNQLGPNWTRGAGEPREERWLREAAAEFDPANRPA